MFGISGLSGMAVGPVIGELILHRFDFNVFFVSFSGIATLGFLVHLPLVESFSDPSSRPLQSFFSVMKKEKVLMAALLAFLFGFGLAASGNFVSPFAKEKDLSFISIYYFTYSSAAVMTRILGSRFADRVGERQVIPYALTLTGVGLFSLVFLQGIGILVLSGLLTGCGHGFLFPSLSALAMRDEPIETRGKITGSFTGSIDAGGVSGSIILGFVGEWAGFRALFFAASLSLFMGLGFFRSRINKTV
jgi:predicted MFS family arabinose efflux permease